MKGSKIVGVAIIVIVIAGIFAFAPIINYTFYGADYGIGSYQVTAHVSPSFYYVGCGLVYNPAQTTTIAGYSHSNLIWSGGEWRCKSS